MSDADKNLNQEEDAEDSDDSNCTLKLKISTEQLIQAVHSRSCLWNKYDVTYRDKRARDKCWTEVYRDVYPEFDMLKETMRTRVATIILQSGSIQWNREGVTYRDKRARDRCWTEVYREVYPEFDMLKETMRTRVGQQISKKWFNIRDAYVKSSKQRRPYIYMNILGFLDPIILGDKSSASQESFLDEDQSENWFQTSFVDIEEVLKKKKLKRVKLDSSDKDYLEITAEPESNTSLVGILARLVEKEEDDDKLFFTSIIPSVKSLTENAKLEFKIQVLKLLKEFKMKDKVGGFIKMRDSDSD